MTIDACFGALGRSVAAHPRRWTAALALVTAATALLWPRFALDPDVARMLPRDNATVALAQALEGEMQSGRTLFLLVGGNAIEAALPALVGSLRSSPLLDEVAATRRELLGPAFARAQQAPVWFLPAATLDDLAARLGPAGIAQAIAGLRGRIASDPLAGAEVARRDPLGLRWILSAAADEAMPVRLRPGTEYVILAGSNRALLRVRGLRPPFDVEFSRAVLADLQSRLQGRPADLLGGYAIACADATRIRGDLISSSVSSMAMVLLFLVCSMRSLLRPLLVLAPTALALSWSLPLGGAVLGPLSPIAISAAAMLIGLGVDFAVHYVAHYQEHRTSLGHAASVELCHRQLGRPLTAAMTTTVAGFAAFGWSRFDGLRGFAGLLTLGLLAAFAATLLAVPLLLLIMPAPRRPDRSAIVAACGRIVASRFGWPVATTLQLLALAGVLLLFCRGLPFVADPGELRPAAQRAELLAREDEIGIAPEPQVILVPAAVPMEALERGCEQLLREPELGIHFIDGPHRDAAGAGVRARVQAFRAAIQGFAATALQELSAQGFAAEPFRPG
jgi:predicted exporter